MEVGLGLHGEPGAASRDVVPVDDIVAQVSGGKGPPTVFSCVVASIQKSCRPALAYACALVSGAMVSHRYQAQRR